MSTKDELLMCAASFERKIAEIIEDLQRDYGPRVEATCVCENAKEVGTHANDIDIAITSPPYLNGTNYLPQHKAGAVVAWMAAFRGRPAPLPGPCNHGWYKQRQREAYCTSSL